MGVIEIISNIGLGVISSLLYDGGRKAKDFIEERDLQGQIQELITKIVTADETGIFESSQFEEYLKYQSLEFKIEEHLESFDHITDSDFIKSLVEDYKNNSIKRGNYVNPLQESALRDFFKRILEFLESQLEEQRNLGEKALSHSINEGFAQNASDLDEIKNMLQQMRNSTSDSTRFAIDPRDAGQILEAIIRLILSGEISETYKICQKIKSGNSDLDKAICVVLYLFTDLYKSSDEAICLLWEKISDDKLKDIVVHLLALHFMVRVIESRPKEKSPVSAESKNNTEGDVTHLEFILKRTQNNILKSIINAVMEQRYSAFIGKKEYEKNGRRYIEYQIVKEYSAEDWLIRRLLVASYNHGRFINNSDLIKDALGKSRTFVDDLLIWENQLFECVRGYYTCHQEISELAKKIRIDAEMHQKTFNQARYEYQIRYFELLLKCKSVENEQDIDAELKLIPPQIASDPNLEPYFIQSKISKDEISEEDAFNSSLRLRRPEIILAFMARVKDSKIVIDVLDRHPESISYDYGIFSVYVNALRQNGRNEQVRDLFQKYKEQYKNTLHYWTSAYRFYFSINDSESKDKVVAFLKKNKSDGLLTTGAEDFLELARIFVNEGLYELALEPVQLLNNANIENGETVEIKSLALALTKQHQNEAFELLRNNFELIKRRPWCVDFILVYSINQGRMVSHKVLDAAINIGTPRLLMLCSEVARQSQDLSESKRLAMRAMLLSDSEHEDIFDSFLQAFVGNNESEVTPEYSDVDTCVVLEREEELDTSKAAKQIYCIYSENELPSDNYIWKNAHHILKDTAVKLDLFRRKVHDTVIIDTVIYRIAEIKKLDAFYFNVCMSSMVRRGRAWEYHFNPNSKEFVKDIVKALEEHGQGGSKFDFKANYQDATYPLTFWALKRFYPIEYGQLIRLTLRDQNVIVREFLDSSEFEKNEEKDGRSNYILSYSALVTLYMLGIDLSEYCEYIVITESELACCQQELRKIYSENDASHVGSLRIENDKPFFYESPDEVKRNNVREAVDFKEYVESFKTCGVTTDLLIDGVTNDTLRDLIGTCDYDAIALSQESGYKLVTNEIITRLLTKMKGSECEAVSIQDFISEIKLPIHDLFKALKKLFTYRFEYTITPSTLLFVADTYRFATAEEKKEILEKWKDLILTPQDQGESYTERYKVASTEIIRAIPSEFLPTQNPIISTFINSVMYFNRIHIEYFIKDATVYYRFVRDAVDENSNIKSDDK